MSIADHPEVGPVAELMLDTLKANTKPGDSPMDLALICVAVAGALIVEASAETPESLQRRLEQALAFMESMVDFNISRRSDADDARVLAGARRTPLGAEVVALFPAGGKDPSPFRAASGAPSLSPKGRGDDGGDAA